MTNDVPPEKVRHFLKEHGWRLRADHYAEKVSGGKWQRHHWIVVVMRLVQDLIEEGNARIIINCPPRHGKSEGLSHWFITWFVDTYPEQSVVLGSYGQELSVSFGRKVRDHFMNQGSESLTEARVRKDKHLAKDWETVEGGGMKSVGVGTGVTGRGGNLILIDDPHKDWAEAMSALKRQRVIEWFNGTLYTRLEPHGSIVVIQTRWHEEDLTGYLMKDHADDWIQITLPAIAEDNDPLGREPGEALCPERYDEAALNRIKEANELVFDFLYQQRPRQKEGEIVKRKWLRYYRQKDLPKEFDHIIHSWDLTFKGDNRKKATSKNTVDYACGTVWGALGARRYLLDYKMEQMHFPDQLKAVKALWNKWGGNAVYVEDAANGQALKHTLSEDIPGVVLVPAKGSKEERLFAVLAQWEAGDVYLPHKDEVPDVTMLVEQLVGFPKMPNDDFVDSSTMALRKLMRKKAKKEIKIGQVERPSPWRSY